MWIATLKEDVRVFRLVHSKRGLLKYLYFPDFRAVVLFRLSQLFFQYRLLRPLAYACTVLNDLLTGVWIGPNVQAGPGLFLGHPRGLVVNPTAIIGSYCSIMQRVTIGGPNVVIGNYVEINAGAQIISNVKGMARLTVGDNVTIGAGSVVVKDIPANSVVVGVPARVVKENSEFGNWYDLRKHGKRESDNGF